MVKYKIPKTNAFVLYKIVSDGRSLVSDSNAYHNDKQCISPPSRPGSAQASGKKKQAEDKEKELKLEVERTAESRPWQAAPYDPTATTRPEMEAIWHKNHADKKLSFPYSGSSIPPPEAFAQVLADWKTSNSRYGHHLQAYLEVGYGTFEFNGRHQADHRYMSKHGLNEIHGRQCTGLGTSHDYALKFLRASPPMYARTRFENGL